MIHWCGTCCYRSNRGHNIKRHEERFHSFKQRLCKFCNKVFRTKFDYYKHVHEAHKDRCRIAPHLFDMCWGIRKMNKEPEMPPTPLSSPEMPPTPLSSPEMPPTPLSSPDDADAPTTQRPSSTTPKDEYPWHPIRSWLDRDPRTLPIKKRLSLEFYWRPSRFAPYSMAIANNFNA
ncbi:hypothetical protein TKK_0005723 [Trichogramma kaykai]|uniref:C2H2-type domain-containing protein n=1 Tax=Trichogramma kaykai TaxID=54128 RepID=A0ABD2XHC1_9HYME